MAGRPKKDRNLKIIQGTFRNNREKPASNVFHTLEAMPKPPGGLGNAGAEVWKSLGAELVESGVLCSPDLPAFLLLCESRDRASTFYNELTKSGKIPLGKATKDKENAPLVRSLKFEADFLRKIYQEFGLTPRSRNTVSSHKKEDDPDTRKMKELLGI